MPNLKRLDLNTNHIGEPYLTEAAKRERQALLASIPEHVRHLAAGAAPEGSDDLKDLGVKALGDAIVSHGALEKLEYLCLDHNGITDAGIQVRSAAGTLKRAEPSR